VKLARKHWTYSRIGGVIKGEVEYEVAGPYPDFPGTVRWFLDPVTREIEINNTGYGGALPDTALNLAKALRTAVRRAEAAQAAYDAGEITTEDME
jgi:hypothetical protein